jgi:winged helix-turn-helix protein
VAPRLTAEQKAQLPHLLAKGAEAYGFRGDVWTARRVAEVIEQTFGVRYHRDHVGRMLREAGWSRQQPIERATQRNEAAITDWDEKRWPTLKKSPRGRTHHRLGATKPACISCQCESRTWAPQGQTPVLRVPLTHDHLSARRRHHARWTTVPASTRSLLRCGSCGRLPTGALAQDHGPDPADLGRIAHPSRPRDQRLSAAAGRLSACIWNNAPFYAPDLNPEEGIWNYLKRVELGNVCCPDPRSPHYRAHTSQRALASQA